MVRGHKNRESFSSTTSSVWVDRHDTNDWIAPCPPGEPVEVDHHDHDHDHDQEHEHEHDLDHGHGHSHGHDHLHAHDHEHSHPAVKAKKTARRRISTSDTREARELWECMLELQQRYGCYRSARMQAAISTYDGTDLMPSRATLDLLNESIIDEELPEDGWRMLSKYLPDLREGHKAKHSWKFWKH